MKAIIYKPAKSASQAGLKNTQMWVLEYEKQPKFIETLNGWTGSKSTSSQVIMKFDTVDEATRFAKCNNIPYEVIEPKRPKFKPSIYANNFK